MNLKDLITKLRDKAIRPHYYCEDPWYSCPLAPEGCADDSYAADECSCGASKRNQVVEELYQQILSEL